jgi:hypothetical protein
MSPERWSQRLEVAGTKDDCRNGLEVQALTMQRAVSVETYRYGRHERTRTADPYRVKVVLYQLSYVPKGVQTRARCEHFGETAKVTKR